MMICCIDICSDCAGYIIVYCLVIGVKYIYFTPPILPECNS